MSTTAQPPPPATHAPEEKKEIKIYGHSMLFYWWPIWAFGFILGILTLFNKTYMVVVPHDAEARRNWRVETGKDKYDTREGVLLENSDDPRKHLAPNAEAKDLEQPPVLKLHMTAHKSYGVLFAIVLLVVIVVTSVPLRGMWSVLVIAVIVMLALIFALFGVWDKILAGIALLDIRINAGGYFFISTVLLIIWLLAFQVFDRRTYMIFSPRQITVCLALGNAEMSFEPTGAVINKAPSDLFRHWILGGGSGDLEVRTAGANAQIIQMHNVLNIGRKLAMAQKMLRTQVEAKA
jgi:hypothetical protein